MNAGEEEFEIDVSGTYPLIHLTSPAERGRANAELVSRMSEILGEKVGIVSGHRSSRKELAVELERREIMERLRNYRPSRRP